MDENNIENKIRSSRIFVFVLFGLTVLGYAAWFWMMNGHELSQNSGDWGTFGDFVGGILNPLVAFSAFYWLTVSVSIQHRELGETRKALVDTSKSQKEQVNIAKLKNQLDLISIEINQLNIELEAELQYLNVLVQIGSDGAGRTTQIFGKDATKVQSDVEIKDTNIRILTLKKQLFDSVEKYKKKLNSTTNEVSICPKVSET